MDKNQAMNYSIDVLLWLAKNQQSLELFLNTSGASPDDLRVRAKDPEFLVFVLDFFMTSDELITNLSVDLKTSPEKLNIARSTLTGGDLPNWT